MAPLPVADSWFERAPIDDATTLMAEPHVIALMRCNIWYVKGRDHDLIVDTGMGLSSVTDELAGLIDKPVIAVATQGMMTTSWVITSSPMSGLTALRRSCCAARR